MTPRQEERRTHKRYGVKDSTVQLAQSGIMSFLKEPSKPFLILNVSEGGASFYYPQRAESRR